MNISKYIKNVLGTMINGLQQEKEQAEKNKAQKQAEGLKDLENYIKGAYEKPGTERPKLPDVPGYERVEYEAPSDEAIKKNAESLLSDYANQSKNAIEQEIDALKTQKDRQREALGEAYASGQKELDRVFGSAKKATDDDLLKRGLARSSIAANKTAALEEGKAREETQISQNYQKAVSGLAEEIAALESKRSKALNDFNIAYAAKLTEQINLLSEQRDKKQKEAITYNNTVAQKEYADRMTKELNESKLYSDRLGQKEKENQSSKISAQEQQEIYAGIYEKMEQLLSTLSAREAKELLESNALFRDSLSDYYYYKLLDTFGRRERV